MSVTLTFYFWWLWPYVAAGAALCVPLFAIAEAQMSGPFRWRRALWRQVYSGESQRTRTLKGIRGYVVIIAFWPVAIWELAR